MIEAGLGVIAFLIVASALALEIQYRRRPGNKLGFTPGTWQWEVCDQQHYELLGQFELRNQTQRLEIMVPEVDASTTLLSDASLDGITCQARVIPCHPDAPARPDGYWFAYIVKTRKTTALKVLIDIQGPDLRALKSVWLRLHYVTYGPQGRIPKTRHVIIPLQYPDPLQPPKWRSKTVADILPIKTHLLSHLDHPVTVVKRYVSPHAQPGDIVTIGETPVAIMQERWRHPTEIQPGWLARRLCYLFLPTSSLATACGLQVLVDMVGPARVLLAFVTGAIAKGIFRKSGLFYQLAGRQARLIDDVTGTLPPYDQFIVLGPEHPQTIVNQIQRETGLGAAIVDVNDLKAVKVLAASPDVSQQLLLRALQDNPAGNADEQTPLVLIRPKV